jgi:hypothetical protein
MTPYDSTDDTRRHITTVQILLGRVVGKFIDRSMLHDASKLEPPEKAVYDEFTPKLRGLTYGSDEYKASLAAMGPALQHHYAHNSHHPEHYPNGIDGMSLLDLMEMLADWKAAGMRHDDGSMDKSMAINRARFHIDDQLFAILQNTVQEMDW